MKLIHNSLRKLLLFWLNPVNFCSFWPTCIFSVEVPLGPSCHLACLIVDDLDENYILGLGSKRCTMSDCWLRFRPPASRPQKIHQSISFCV